MSYYYIFSSKKCFIAGSVGESGVFLSRIYL